MNKDDMSLSARAAYIKGLAEGQELEPDKKAGRVIAEMLDLLVAMADDVEGIGEDLTDLYEVVDEIDENLGFVEEMVFGEDGGCSCGHDHEEVYEITCPRCGEVIHADEDVLLQGELKCPACGEVLELDDEIELGMSIDLDSEE